MPKRLIAMKLFMNERLLILIILVISHKIAEFVEEVNHHASGSSRLRKCHHMILHNTDALRIADTHVVHRHQISFKSLLTIFVCRFTFLFHFVISTWVQRYNFYFEFRHSKDTKRKGSRKHLRKRLQLPSLYMETFFYNSLKISRNIAC